MTRWISVGLLVCLVAGLAIGLGPARAQDAPVAGQVREFQVDGVGRPISLSPDGTRYAVAFPREALCVYDTETQQEVSCGSLDALDSGIRLQDVVWSPDSTRLAFGEDGLVLGNDGDLWVMDAQSGAVTNLTDDGYQGSMFSLGDDASDNATFFVDVAPAWTPDGQFITFSRSAFVQGERTGNDIAQVPAAGGEIEILATIPGAEAIAVYAGTGWDPSGTTFYFSRDDFDTNDRDSGIWTLDPATGTVAPLATGLDPELGPLSLLRVSPAGDRLLAWYPMASARFEADETLLRLVDPSTGALSTPEVPGASAPGAALAAFSPDGQALLLVTFEGSGLYRLWVSDLAGGEPRLLVDELETVSFDFGQMPTWGANGTVLLGKGPNGGYLVPVEGIGLAQAPPAASPVAGSQTGGSPVGGPVRSVELPGGRAISMSPDGQYLAAAEPSSSLCVYAVETLAKVSCADLTVLTTDLRVEDVVWSPDSSRLAFSENTFLSLRDGDLWVMDAATGALTNLTDDGYTDTIFSLGDDPLSAEYFVDVAPAWTPDGQFITFSRTLGSEEGATENVIAQIPATGGEVETLTTVADAPGVFYYRGEWSPDGQRFYYSVVWPDPDNPDNGIWVYDAATAETALLAVTDDPQLGPLVLQEVSPAGDRLLAYYPAMLASGGFVNQSLLRFVDPTTGALSPVPEPAPESEIYEGTAIATFSPDGQYLLQAVGIDSRGFWVTNLATGEATQVASELEQATPIALGLGPVWGTDGTVFVGRGITGAHFFTIEGVGTGPVASDQATPASEAGSFGPGSTAMTNSLTPVFAAPDANAVVVQILAPNREVQVLGEPVENEQGAWYPVRDPDTQIIGYVQASRLS